VFDFDPDKSAANLAKYGIDFETAQALWLDERQGILRARSDEEERWAVVGAIDGKLWTAIVTYRDDHIRIISVRRSRAGEELAYGNENDLGS
jgi:uncharacterized protein